MLGRSDYQWQHEPVLYGFMQNGKHPWYSDRKQTTIWNFAKPKRNANHPTSKPLDLLGYPIGNSTQENAIVIDTFGGSGSTLMACEQIPIFTRSNYSIQRLEGKQSEWPGGCRIQRFALGERFS